MNNHLKDILIALARAEIKFVVCGGVAVVLHGVERLTLDIDLAVSMERDNLSALIDVIKDLNMVPRVPVDPAVMLDPEKRRIMREEKRALVFTFIDNANPYRQIDVFLSDEKLYDSLIDESMIVNFDNYPVPIVSLEQLIDMKRNVNPPREKDLSDIGQLVRIMEERNEE